MTATAELPIEGALPDLGGATRWLNSEPLTPAGLRGKVVVVQFSTFSCINWLRTLPTSVPGPRGTETTAWW